jgi:hypothetical protein
MANRATVEKQLRCHRMPEQVRSDRPPILSIRCRSPAYAIRIPGGGRFRLPPKSQAAISALAAKLSRYRPHSCGSRMRARVRG